MWVQGAKEPCVTEIMLQKNERKMREENIKVNIRRELNDT